MIEWPTLYLPLKRVYFEQIASGEKTHEFRLVTPHWRKRLVGRKYDKIVITCGYPKRGDSGRTLVRKWMGEPEIQTITHEHFGPEPVEVFAIDVREVPVLGDITHWRPRPCSPSST